MTEYERAVREFRSATDAYNLMGEPESGPIRDRLDLAVDQFIRADRRKASGEDDEDGA
ncbi:hypothetical protein [Nocardia altamirensis]|uniref:hypothetical protein n=1 Tax=Nocardia altamirensis TaxID=472158 RepID=UPI0014355C34|nr:hypothetical protein [Nocardia altamirensis]